MPPTTNDVPNGMRLAADAHPALTDTDRRQAIEDLRYWRAAVPVLPPGYHEPALRRTVDLLLGPGIRVDGAWTWDVRSLVP